MNSKQITSRLKSIKSFQGVCARDVLPKKFNKPASLVANTDSRNQEGEHWVAFYITKNRTEYFDPLGFPPLGKSLTSFVYRNTRKRYYFSCKALQNSGSTLCGKYCIAFIKHRASGKSYVSFINKFSRNSNKNDILIRSKSI